MTTPTPIQAFDDLDHLIYDLRFRQHQSQRAIAAETGMSTGGVRYRIRRMLRLVAHEDVDQMREEEGTLLDELAAQNSTIARIALDPKREGGPDLDTGMRALKEIHAISKTRQLLFGLERNQAPAPTADQLNDTIRAYMQGRADVQAETDA